jgi:hypothetical protein
LHQSDNYHKSNYEVFAKFTGSESPEAYPPVGEQKGDPTYGEEVSTNVKQRAS